MDSAPIWTARGLEEDLFKQRALIVNLKTIINDKVYRKHQATRMPLTNGVEKLEHKADCALTIWDGHVNEQCKQNRTCSIIEETSDVGKATVKMVEPFSIDPSIFIKRPDTTAGSLLYNFSMQIAIIPSELTDNWPPLSINLPKAQTRETTDESGVTRYPFLVVNWQRLPDLPDEAQPLRITARQDNKNLKTPLRAHLEAKFTAPSAPLKTYNIKSLSKQSSRAQQPSESPKKPLTPSKPKTPVKPVINVKWYLPKGFEEITEVEFQGYVCPLCRGTQHESVDEYHFHLISSHDLFKFRLDWTSSAPSEDQIRYDVKVQFKVKDQYGIRASNSAPDPEEFHWTKPKSLFDLEEYLRGGDAAKAWTLQEGTQRSSKQLAEDDAPPTKKQHRKSHAHNDLNARKAPRIPPPSAIPDLPMPARPTFPVPKAPEGVRFYHAKTKIPLNEGDEHPESDDDMDETWLLQKHDVVIRQDPQLSDATKEFIVCYDRHMFREKLSSSLHLGQALVRFARAHREFLLRKDMYAEFQKCMANWVCHQCISPLTVRVCSEIVRGGDGNRAFTEMERAKTRAEKGITEEELEGEEVSIMDGGDEMEGVE